MKTLVINSADFSSSKIEGLYYQIDIQKSEYIKPNGYYTGNIVIDTTNISDLTLTSDNRYYNRQIPVESGKEYKLKSFELKGNSILIYALLNTNGTILAYKKVQSGGDTMSDVFMFSTTLYPTAASILICYRKDIAVFPELVYREESI